LYKNLHELALKFGTKTFAKMLIVQVSRACIKGRSEAW